MTVDDQVVVLVRASEAEAFRGVWERALAAPSGVERDAACLAALEAFLGEPVADETLFRAMARRPRAIIFHFARYAAEARRAR